MDKKNYITQEEQRIWEYIKDKEIVDNELVKQIFPDISDNKRNKILHSLYKKGYLKRARKDLYYNSEELKSFYILALKMREGYIGLSSALRYYNLIEYEDFTIFVMTKSFQKKTALKGTQYSIEFIPLKNLFTGFEMSEIAPRNLPASALGKRAISEHAQKHAPQFSAGSVFDKKENIYISSIEKTLFDCFLKPRFIGFTSITKALYDAKPDWNKFIGFFKLTKNSSLCQRTGYILELMKKKTKMKIPSFVFEFLLKKVKNPVKLLPINTRSAFNRKWKVQDNIGEKNILSWWY